MLRTLVYVLPAVLFFSAAVIDVNPSGTRVLRYDIRAKTAMLSEFFPADRLAAISGSEQRVRKEPVYFTVRYPHPYRTAQVRVAVNNPDGLRWLVGLETQGREWSYSFAEPDQDGAVIFDLHAARITNGSIRLIIAIRDLDDTHHFALRGAEVTLMRPNLLQTIVSKWGRL